jgi:hypothetical protein
VEDLIYRIFNKKIILRVDNEVYTVVAPSVELRYKAEIYKDDLINNHKYDLPHIDFYNKFLVNKKFIDKDYESKIINMTEAIKRLKVALYNSGPQIEIGKKIRKDLKTMKEKLNKYFDNIEFYRRQSLEYFADGLKNKFILINTVYQNNELVFNSKDLNLPLLSTLIIKLNQMDISITDFRKIARSDNWRNYWLGNKYNLFGIPAIELSEDQKILCMFSRMYDNVYEHPDHPSDEIIEDDDKLDGWLITEQDKNKEDKKQKNITQIEPKYQEVFKSASTPEEASSIYNSNTEQSKRILRERAQVLKTIEKEVKDTAFKDVRLDVLKKSSEAESARIKRM